MDQLGAFQSFVAAVETGSLSGAARRRNLSQPAISQQISALEAHLGTQLLQRGRGGVQMTGAGEVAYPHARAMLAAHEELRAGLDTLSHEVTGRLVVTANLGFSQHVLSDVIVDLRRAHPGLEIELRPDSRLLDLPAEGIDIALRTGDIGTGGGVVRKIAAMSELFVATPAYLDQAGRPRTPQDLSRLDFIQFKVGAAAISLQRGQETVTAPIRVGFTAQFPALVEKALSGGLGYAKVPRFLAEADLRSGRLEAVLPAWQIAPTDLFVLFADREKRAPRFAAFLSVLLAHLGRTAGIDVLPSARRLWPG